MSTAAATEAYDKIRKAHSRTSNRTCACGWTGKNVDPHLAAICRKATAAYLKAEKA